MLPPRITTRICPRCAETIKASAIACRFCGNEFTLSGIRGPGAEECLAALRAQVERTGHVRFPPSLQDTMNDCLNAGGDPNSRLKGYPLIHIAAASGYLDAIRALLARGVDVNGGSGKFDEAPLYSAILQHQWAAAFLLIEKGADVNRERFDGFRPLDAFHGAPLAGEPERARLHATLVAMGATRKPAGKPS